jgi:hypothetical protein
MRKATIIRSAISLGVAAAGSWLSILLFAPPAYGLIVPPVGDSASSAVAVHAAPSTAHNLHAGGVAGWQIALIAFGAALLAATVAVCVDRARTANRGLRVSAA